MITGIACSLLEMEAICKLYFSAQPRLRLDTSSWINTWECGRRLETSCSFSYLVFPLTHHYPSHFKAFLQLKVGLSAAGRHAGNQINGSLVASHLDCLLSFSVGGTEILIHAKCCAHNFSHDHVSEGQEPAWKHHLDDEYNYNAEPVSSEFSWKTWNLRPHSLTKWTLIRKTKTKSQRRTGRGMLALTKTRLKSVLYVPNSVFW